MTYSCYVFLGDSFISCWTQYYHIFISLLLQVQLMLWLWWSLQKTKNIPLRTSNWLMWIEYEPLLGYNTIHSSVTSRCKLLGFNVVEPHTKGFLQEIVAPSIFITIFVFQIVTFVFRTFEVNNATIAFNFCSVLSIFFNNLICIRVALDSYCETQANGFLCLFGTTLNSWQNGVLGQSEIKG